MIKNITTESLKNKEFFENIPKLDRELLIKGLNDCTTKIRDTIDFFGEKSPSPVSKNQLFEQIENVEWTTGFWVGELWLAYEYTKDEYFKKNADIQIKSFINRIKKKIEVAHHDMGFLYSLSCVADYKLTGNTKSKEAALLATENLVNRYQEKGKFIQAWGELGAKDNYRLIIDCLMNIPLLFWAYGETKEKKYYDIAVAHCITTCNTAVRSDASSFHTFFFDPDTGSQSHGAARQGYSDDSAWARGQAWGIYGLALTYTYTKDQKILDIACALLNFFLNRCPEDFIPYWDLIFTKEDGHVRDSSAAVIAVCGMLELDKHLSEDYPNKKSYQGASSAIMNELVNNYSTSVNCPESNGLLLHGIYNWNFKSGIDECTSWGDYFYMEALFRMYTNNQWQPYW